MVLRRIHFSSIRSPPPRIDEPRFPVIISCMKIYCPTCSREIPAEDINISLAAAKCSACNSVFQFDEMLRSPAAAEKNRLPVPTPKKYTIEEFGSDLTIRWRWYTHAVWFLVFFCVFWDGFLFAWYSALFAGGMAMKEGGWFWLVPALFPLRSEEHTSEL